MIQKMVFFNLNFNNLIMQLIFTSFSLIYVIQIKDKYYASLYSMKNQA